MSSEIVYNNDGLRVEVARCVYFDYRFTVIYRYGGEVKSYEFSKVKDRNGVILQGVFMYAGYLCDYLKYIKINGEKVPVALYYNLKDIDRYDDIDKSIINKLCYVETGKKTKVALRDIEY